MPRTVTFDQINPVTPISKSINNINADKDAMRRSTSTPMNVNDISVQNASDYSTMNDST